MTMQTSILWGGSPITLTTSSFTTEVELIAYLRGVADAVGFSDSQVITGEAAATLNALGGFGSADWEALAKVIREHEGHLPVGAA